jgi:hypothetical protein
VVASMTILIAIDPGDLSGWAVIETENGRIIESDELTEFEVSDSVEYWLKREPDVTIVMEKFTITTETAKKSPQPTAMYIIGAVRFLYNKYQDKVVPLQTPADAKSFSTNEKLKAVGLWHVGGEGHAKDALRHALLWMVRHNELPNPERLLQ